jgi:amidase
MLTDASSLPAEIWRWSAADMAHQIRSGAISSHEAVVSCYARIAEKNPALNAIVHMDEIQAINAARAADKARAEGRSLGILHGVPITVKWNVDVEDEATTNGVAAFKDRIAPADSAVVANLRAAGAVIVGRTNTPPFSFRWFTENSLHGRTQNPWSAEISSGGSSGGAGVAAAVGMCPIAHGTDIAGSIRYPAYVNGVVGLRTTTGRVPAHHPTTAMRFYGLQTMSSQGPLTRTVRDARLALVAMSMANEQDATWVDAKLEYPDDASPVSVALVDHIDGIPIAPEVQAALVQAARSLEADGYIVERATPPSLAEGVEIWQSIVMTESRLNLLPGVEAMDDPVIRQSVHNMANCGATVDDTAGYIKAIAQRDDYRRRWLAFLHRYPLVLMPTSCQLPQKWGTDLGTLEEMKHLVAAQSPLMAIAVMGLPGVHVPTGLSGGVPTGVQLVSNSFREMRLLAAAEVIERSVAMASGTDL